MKQYDYIICGTGCAGLTFLYEVLLKENLCSKKILLVDSDLKNKNDRTWCFWEKGDSKFSHLVHHKWYELHFKSNQFTNSLQINPYQYKMIRGLDFYRFIIEFAKKFKNVHFAYEEVLELKNSGNQVYVKTISEQYFADYVFNSIVFNKKIISTPNSLLQHFKGVEIETNKNCFDATKATFMDFSISQQKGTSFMYVLPTSSKTALIEYTLFTKNLLKDAEYDAELAAYIKNTLAIENYEIKHTESGIIPMTDYNFPLYEGNIINLGTAAGCIKPSSGFAFSFIQKHTKQIVSLLSQNKKPYLKRTFMNKKFHLYDCVLLEVMARNKMRGDEIFASIFKKNAATLLLKFLDNETSLYEDLRILSSVPTKIFFPIALKKMF